MSGLEDKLVCSFKLVADVIWCESGGLWMTLTDQHFWKGIVWMSTDRVIGLESIP